MQKTSSNGSHEKDHGVIDDPSALTLENVKTSEPATSTYNAETLETISKCSVVLTIPGKLEEQARLVTAWEAGFEKSDFPLTRVVFVPKEPICPRSEPPIPIHIVVLTPKGSVAISGVLDGHEFTEEEFGYFIYAENFTIEVGSAKQPFPGRVRYKVQDDGVTLSTFSIGINFLESVLPKQSDREL